MKNVVSRPDSNIIDVSFGASQVGQEIISDSELSNLIEDYKLEDDPLEDLFSEFDDLTDEIDLDHHDVKLDLLPKPDLKRLSVSNNPVQMADMLIEQTGIIKTDLEKLKYYLNEMNLD